MDYEEENKYTDEPNENFAQKSCTRSFIEQDSKDKIN